MSTADLISKFLHVITSSPSSRQSTTEGKDDVIVLPERWNQLHEFGPLLCLRRPCPDCGWDGNPAHLLRVTENHWNGDEDYDDDEFSRGHYLFDRISEPTADPCVSCAIAIKFRNLCVADRPELAGWDLDRWTNQGRPCLVFRDPFMSEDDYEWNIFLAANGNVNAGVGDEEKRDARQHSKPAIFGLPYGELVPETTATDASLEWARKQIADCMTSHKSCRSQRSTDAFLPTRLLDIGSDSETDGPVRLIESATLSHSNSNNNNNNNNNNNGDNNKDKEKDTRYIALSHCWGLKPIECMTTRANVEAQKRGIAWSALPATFRDVVRLARRLGVRYVWIDSLCIVQRDRDDWLREAGRMMHVYRHAHLTVGAAHAADSSGGLFSHPNPNPNPKSKSDLESGLESKPKSHLNLGKICLRGGGGGGGGKEYRHGSASLYAQPSLADTTNPYLVHRAEPLFRRAWTFQERVVSPRILYFAAGELVWECYEATACQCGFHCYNSSSSSSSSDVVENVKSLKMSFFEYLPSQGTMASSSSSSSSNPVKNSDANNDDDDNVSSSSSFPPDDNNNNTNHRHNLEKSWRKMVGFYSSLALTNATDKLLAIGALAEHVQAARPDERYLAGLWSRSLHADLLWRARQPTLGRPDLYTKLGAGVGVAVAPTWSWASVRSAVRFEADVDGRSAGGGGVVPAARIVSISCPYVDDNPFGLADGRGRLTLRGRVIAGCRLYRRVTGGELIGTKYFVGHPDLEGVEVQVYRDSEDGLDVDVDADADGDGTGLLSVCLLRVAETSLYPVPLCIALQKKKKKKKKKAAATDDDDDEGVFQRWGYVEPPLLRLHKLHEREIFNQWFTKWSVEETCVIE